MQNGADMTALSVSSDGSLLSFINKKDGSLWLVNFSKFPPATQ
jgi:hypothetical protein